MKLTQKTVMKTRVKDKKTRHSVCITHDTGKITEHVDEITEHED